MALEIISSAPRYDYHVVETTPVRLRYDNFGNAAEVTRWASAPEYGAGRVLAIGFKIKKDGTPGRQYVKPVVELSACPPEVRAAFAAAGYGVGLTNRV